MELEHNLKTTLLKLQDYLSQTKHPKHPNKIFLETEADLKAMIEELQQLPGIAVLDDDGNEIDQLVSKKGILGDPPLKKAIRIQLQKEGENPK